MSERTPYSDAGDYGETVLDPLERTNATLYLEDPDAGDDEPWSPPSRMPRGTEFLDDEHETINERSRQEEPDVPQDGTDGHRGDSERNIPEKGINGSPGVMGQPWTDHEELGQAGEALPDRWRSELGESPEGWAMHLVGDQDDQDEAGDNRASRARESRARRP